MTMKVIQMSVILNHIEIRVVLNQSTNPPSFQCFVEPEGALSNSGACSLLAQALNLYAQQAIQVEQSLIREIVGLKKLVPTVDRINWGNPK